MSILLACDPGLATFGVVLVDFDRDGAEVIAEDVFIAPATPKKKRKSLTHDRLMRTRQLALWLRDMMHIRSVDVVAAEGLAGTQGAAPAIAMGLGWGVLAALSIDLPTLIVGPNEWRKHLTGTTDEDEAHIEAIARIPLAVESHVSPPHLVHALDARGVAAWALDQPLCKQLNHGRAA